mgnify:CR=1 FL=1
MLFEVIYIALKIMTIKKEIWLINQRNKNPLNLVDLKIISKNKSFPNNIFSESNSKVYVFLNTLNGFSQLEFAYNLLWVGVKLNNFCKEGNYSIMNIKELNCYENLLLGWCLGEYTFEMYKSKKKKKLKKSLSNLTDKIRKKADAIFTVRDLINLPANLLGPNELYASVKNKYLRSFDKKILVKDEKLKKDFPLVFEVGKGSEKSKKPIFAEFSWIGKKKRNKKKKIILIGKGVTFDTGGLNLKTGSGMTLMKKDMGGAANCIGLSKMLVESKIDIDLRLMLPLVENSVSGKSMRPSDIFKSRKGIFVEVEDTDAEGRLILADVISYACESNPDLIIDMATLTGASRVALGTDVPSFFTNNEDIATNLIKCSLEVGDPIWQLPLWKNYTQQLNSNHADIKNLGGTFGGAITAALFLNMFVDKNIDWIHVDLMAWNLSKNLTSYIGGEAMGIRSLFRLIEKNYT